MLSRIPRYPRRPGKRPSGVIFVTQLLDPTDPVVGFVANLLPSLAARCDRLLVIANELRAVPETIDADFESLGKERGRGRLIRTLRYETLLMRLARDRSFSGLFAHMSPIYASLASPVLRPCGMRVVLWFAHPRDSLQLAVAERLSSAVLTSLPGAYPRLTTKATPIGQAIDTDRWRFVAARKPGPALRVVALGRTSPVKNYPVLIRAVTRARERELPIQLRVVGPATTSAESRHREELVSLVDHLDLEGAVEILDGVPPHAVPKIVAEADVVVNATRPGSGDKIVFEAMAAGRLVVVSNPAFAELLKDHRVELTFPDGDVDALVECLALIAQLSVQERAGIGRQLRERIVTGHSLSSWTRAVVCTVTGAPATTGFGETP
jgi:glycosyltransferase involved in cell wall biosynthesis